jgi:hypothetical protein
VDLSLVAASVGSSDFREGGSAGRAARNDLGASLRPYAFEVGSKEESGSVPDWIKDVVWDLQDPKPINVQLGFVTTEHGGQFWISEQDEPGGAGCAISPDDSSEARVELAYWLQEQFFAESRGAWGEARPLCPSHSHPSVPSELDGEAWWVCPIDGHRVGLIGQLGH